jgi:phosphoribosyl 1,2-cyclic phosphodiesterase
MMPSVRKKQVPTRFSVRFWGVRGSLATSGPDFAHVGGNTSCVEVRLGNQLIILDAGTGLYRLGLALPPRVEATILLSHFHWDHIQGFPFFRPAYEPNSHIKIYGPGRDATEVEEALRRQMEPPHFPVPLASMEGRFEFGALHNGDEIYIGETRVQVRRLNHPQECLGYRISLGSKSIAYVTDTEHLENGSIDPHVLDLARDATVLIYDAQYTDAEYHGEHGRSRKGWGHSTVSAACRVARAARVKRLVLFHHDPCHDDELVGRLVDQATLMFPHVVAACEGMELELHPSAEQLSLNGNAHAKLNGAPIDLAETA